MILLGDLNTRIGTDYQDSDRVIRSAGICQCNSNDLLNRKRAEHDLQIPNTGFHLPNRNKTSWMHPRSKHRHPNDNVAVRISKWQNPCVQQTTGQIIDWMSTYSTSKSSLHVNHKARKCFDVSKLKQDKETNFLIDICNNVGALQLSSEDPEGNWTVFQNAFHSSAFDTLGHTAYTRHTKTIQVQTPYKQPTTPFLRPK